MIDLLSHLKLIKLDHKVNRERIAVNNTQPWTMQINDWSAA